MVNISCGVMDADISVSSNLAPKTRSKCDLLFFYYKLFNTFPTHWKTMRLEKNLDYKSKAARNTFCAALTVTKRSD